MRHGDALAAVCLCEFPIPVRRHRPDIEEIYMTVLRWLRRLLIAALALLVVVSLGLWLTLRGSLPELDGQITVGDLAGPVTVQRDTHGVPTISGDNRFDVAYATGFVHAQDRFFQMDVLRRAGAGELAALFGPSALAKDRDRRLHRFSARAKAMLDALPAQDRRLLEHYTAGVNDGLAKLRVRPFEYIAFQTAPRPWEPVDSLLVICSMYFELQEYQEPREAARRWFREHSSPEQFAFFFPTATGFDAPLDAKAIDTTSAAVPAEAPDWLRKGSGSRHAASTELLPMVGSNNWAISGSRGQNGSALVANDMHLALTLPNTWYRSVLRFKTPQGATRSVAGVTLPGLPYVVAGSNGQVAWGLTNSNGKYVDLIEVHRDPSDPLRVQTLQGWERAHEVHERIDVRGGPPITMTVLETSAGPVRESQGRWFAVRWVAHQPGAVNLRFGRMEDVLDVATALALVNRSGIPAQNIVAGDSAGHIGWTIAGALPRRQPNAAAGEETGAATDGLLEPERYPRVMDPAGRQLWTANNRQLAGPAFAVLGDGGSDLGARARQIRDRLTALPPQAKESDVLEIAFDDRALLLADWRERVLKVLDEKALAGHPERVEFRRIVADEWSGHAAVDSVAYSLVREYFYAVYHELFHDVNVRLKDVSARATFNVTSARWPVTIARLFDEAPTQWLPDGRSWQDVQLSAIDQAIKLLTEGGQPLAAAKWGERNRVAVLHRLARAAPFLAPYLGAPKDPQAGDDHMPRVATPNFGQSVRMVVAPGHEAHGIISMPGGQSGHPLSPYFLADHKDWIKGAPSSFLPGPARHTLTFTPG